MGTFNKNSRRGRQNITESYKHVQKQKKKALTDKTKRHENRMLKNQIFML